MFNFIKTSFSVISNLINVVKAPKQKDNCPQCKLPQAPSNFTEIIQTEAKVTAKTRKAKTRNEIDNIFLELSKEMNISFVKGPFAPKQKTTIPTIKKEKVILDGNFEAIKQIKTQKHLSWIMINEGCNTILNNTLSRPGSKSGVNSIIKASGLTVEQIQEIVRNNT